MKILQFLLLVIFSNTLFSQSFILKDLDKTDYPRIKAKAFYLDDNNNRLDLSGTQIFENGIAINPSFSCPPLPQPRPLSIVLTLDVSGSMSENSNMTNAKNAAKDFIDLMDPAREEIAITSFDDFNYLNQDFTTNKVLLNNAIDQLIPEGGTNYNMGIYQPPAGATEIAKTSTNKAIIVFLTDGISSIEFNLALSEVQNANAEFYAISLRNKMPPELKELSTQTGGDYFEDVTNGDDLSAVYKTIFFKARGGEACDIDWTSENCERRRSVRAVSSTGIESNELEYSVTGDVLSYFEYADKENSYHGEILPGNFNELQFRIKAINNDINITDIISSNADFSISDWGGSNPPFTLNKDQERTLTIRFDPSIEDFQFTRFEVVSDACENKYFYSTGGRKDTPDRDIQVIAPNGGELFIVGIDTIITWEGGFENDTFKIEYSTDAGNAWTTLEEKFVGIEYNWDNIPDQPSKECLVRVSFNSDLEDNWSERVFSRLTELQNLIIENDSENNIIIAVPWDGDIRFLDLSLNEGGPNQQSERMLIVKFDQDREVIWYKELVTNEKIVLGDLDIDAAGNVIIAGQFRSSMTHEGVTINTPGSSLDMFVCKLDKNGDLVALKQAANDEYQEVTSVATSTDGRVYVAGIALRKIKYGTYEEKLPDDDGNFDYQFFLLQLDDQLNYIDRLITTGQSEVRSDSKIKINDDDEIFIGLTYFGENFLDWGSGGTNLKVPILRDIYIARLDDQLRVQEDLYIESNGNLDVLDLDSRISGELYLTGKYNRDINAGNGVFIPKNGTDNNVDIFVVKFDSDINTGWGFGYGSDKQDSRSNLTALKNGGAAIASNFLGDIIINGELISPNSGIEKNIVLTRIDADGLFPRVRRLTQGGNAEPYTMSSDNKGIYYLAGKFTSSIFSDDLELRSGGTDLFVRKYADSVIASSDESDAFFEIYRPSIDDIQFINRIDFGEVRVNTNKDSLVIAHLTNLKDREIRITNARVNAANSIFSLMSDIIDTKIAQGESIDIELRFNPQNEIFYQEELEIELELGEKVFTTITGTGVDSKVLVYNPVIDFGKVPLAINKERNGELLLMNKGDQDLKITEVEIVGPDLDQFKFNFTDSIVAAGEEFKVDFSFLPLRTGRSSSKVIIEFDDLASPGAALLFGEGLDTGPLTVEIFTDNKRAASSARTSLPIKITSAERLFEVGVSKVSTTMSFNSTLLYPIRNTPDGEFDNYILNIPLELTNAGQETLENLEFVATLGDSPSTEIKFSNTKMFFEDGSEAEFVNVTERTATFTLSDVCYEGGTRLIIDRGRLDFSIAPNPVEDVINFEMSLIEKGHYTIELYNSNGAFISHIYESDLSAGVYTIIYPTNELSSGKYFIKVNSPSESYLKTFMISE